MAGQATKDISAEELWGGGRSPFSVSYGKMMMWFFLVSDALTFGGLLIAYGNSRHVNAVDWPVGEQVFDALPGGISGAPLIYVALMTFILIISSVTMVLAVEAGHRNDHGGVKKWMLYTVIGGFFFVGSQAWEWSHFIHGSGGGYRISEAVNVTDKDGNAVQVNKFDMVYFASDFGHNVEHFLDHETEMAMAGGHAGHDDHGHAEHGDHGEEAHFDLATANPGSFTLRKYAPGKVEITDPTQVAKLWNARAKDNFASTTTFGANLQSSEYAEQKSYAGFFFFITGFHGFHVFSGVIINLIIFIMVAKGVFRRRGHYEMVEKVGLYWHFVDLVWVFVFTFFYLV